MAAGAPCDLPPAYVYESNIHIGNILMTLNEQRKCGLLCDISIIVQETEFKAHKAILASCSSYFNRIITDPANVSHNIVLELSSISKAGMESLLEFAYTSKLTVHLGNIDDVICAARELEFKNIEFSCLSYLKQQLLAGKSSSCLLGQETSTVCGNSTISRHGEQQFTKQGKSSDCCLEKKPSSKPEKSLASKNECPILSKLSFGSKKKSGSMTSEDRKSSKCSVGASKVEPSKGEPCDQMSQEQHQAMIKKILEQHGLEAATVDEKAMDLGATGTNTSSMGYGHKKMSGYLSPAYNSDTDEAGSVDSESDIGLCSSRPCGKMRKQPAIKLPFTMDEITSMPRSELHDMLTRDPNLTQEQICAIHEIRRRGKNRIAAQRCRKRKMECIKSLVHEIETLRSEHAQLMKERRDAREQAIKLSDKFRAKCGKFFKCDKSKCSIRKKFCGSSSTPAPPEEQQPVLTADQLTAQNFQEHAERAYDLCEKLKEVPTEDLPPCAATVGENSWPRQCMSPESEEIICSIVEDSNDANYQASSPTTTYAMSPGQGLRSDFHNIHISSPGGAQGDSAASAVQPRSSVLLHTSFVEGHVIGAQVLPPLNTIANMGAPGFTSAATIEHPRDAQMTDLTRLSQCEE